MFLLCVCFNIIGVLREGDELLEINGIALMGKSTDEIIRIMVSSDGKHIAHVKLKYKHLIKVLCK